MNHEHSQSPPRAEPTPDAAPPHPTGSHPTGVPSPEHREREAARRRGAERARRATEGDAVPRDPYAGLAGTGVAHRAFAALAENVRDYAIFLIDPDGVIIFWGEGARLIKGWTKEQVEGAHLRVLYPNGGAEDGTAAEHLAGAAETGEFSGEGHRVRSDGSTFWAGVTLTALRDETGVLLGFAKTTRDLTARRAAAAVLRTAHEMAEEARVRAEEASRAKSLFLATISHETRTPLNAIMAYTDMLEMEIAGPVSPDQRRHLERIRFSSMHLLEIVDQVLEYARTEAGRTVVRLATGRVGAVVEEALAMVAPQAEGRGVEIADKVSGFAAELAYRGDQERARQILVNLISNAVKFTPRGGRITLSAGTAAVPPANAKLEGPGPWVYLQVEDTGSGIPPDRLDAIFEPFTQVDMSYTRQHGGTGLGLSISRQLARLMGGNLTVHSSVGVGSAFFLWLPAAPEEGAPVPNRGDAADPG